MMNCSTWEPVTGVVCEKVIAPSSFSIDPTVA